MEMNRIAQAYYTGFQDFIHYRTSRIVKNPFYGETVLF